MQTKRHSGYPVKPDHKEVVLKLVPYPTNDEIMARNPQARELRQRLLGIGGTHVCLAEHEFNLPALLKRGQTFETTGLRMRRLAHSLCHRNAATLWCQDYMKVSIATGYGLSDDGRWRQHSWAVKDGRVIETTECRTAYLGIELTLVEALAFTLSNPPKFLLSGSGGDRTEMMPLLLAKLTGDDVKTVKQGLRTMEQGQ